MDELLDLESLKKLTPTQQEQVIAGVKQQAAITNAQNLITVTSFNQACTVSILNDHRLHLACLAVKTSRVRFAVLRSYKQIKAIF